MSEKSYAGTSHHITSHHIRVNISLKSFYFWMSTRRRLAQCRAEVQRAVVVCSAVYKQARARGGTVI